MTEYFGGNATSYQQQSNGYYYQPYVDNGSYAQILNQIGGIVGSTLETIVGEDAAGPLGENIGSVLGGDVGQELGQVIGFYIDNMSAISRNLDTYVSQLNDQRMWLMPNIGF